MNKNLKRIAALLLAIAMVASFAACKNDKITTTQLPSATLP